MKASTAAIRFLQTLHIPEGPKAGRPLKLAPFQKQFVRGALADGHQRGVPVSIGRGNAKTALACGHRPGRGDGRMGSAAPAGNPDRGADAGSGAHRVATSWRASPVASRGSQRKLIHDPAHPPA